MKIAVIAALACLGISSAAAADQSAQSAPKPKGEAPGFEVVSIKPCPSAPMGGGTIKTTPIRLRLQCFTVDELIRMAFGIVGLDVLPHAAEAPVKGGPSWIRSKRFTIDAKTEKPSTLEEMIGSPLRDLLKERFKLKAHEQARTTAVYDLTQAQGGAKLQIAKDGSCFEMAPGKAPPAASGGQPPPPICGGYRVSPAGGVDAYRVTMRDLCRRMSFALDRDVIDKTGIEGVYNLHLETTLEELSRFKAQRLAMREPSNTAVPEAMDPGGSIFTAMRKIGLQLKPGTKLGKLIVIDQVEMPDAN